MASQQTREDTDDTKCSDAIEGLDITVDGCSPEFEVWMLRDEIDKVRHWD